MDNLFSGLEEFGLDNLSNINIYDEEEKQEAEVKKKRAIPFLKRILYLIRHFPVRYAILTLKQRAS